MSLGKNRVYQMAKELGISNRELLVKIRALGIDVKNHMSVLETEDALRIRRAVRKDREENTVEVHISPTVIRRRSQSRLKPLVPQPPVPEEPALPLEMEEEPYVLEVGPEPEPEVEAGPEPVEQPSPEAEPALEEGEGPREEAIPAEAFPLEEAPGTLVPEGPPVEAPSMMMNKEPQPEVEEALSKDNSMPSRQEAPGEAEPLVEPQGGYPAVEAAPPQTLLEPEARPKEARRGEKAVSEARAPQREAKPSPARKVERKGAGAQETFEQPASVAMDQGDLSAENADLLARKGLGPKKPSKKAPPPNKKGAPRGETAEDRSYRPARFKKKKAKPRKPEITIPRASKRVIKMEDTIVVADLAKRMGVKASEVLKKLLSQGVMVNINQVIDFDTATFLSQEFNYEVESVAFEEAQVLPTHVDQPEELQPRPPVVTVMGHIDHGKTTLLDAIRSSSVASSEHGGITQHVGAYGVHLDNGDIVFIDTPGHAVFTKMRARGAQVTDLVILVVAADDGVMPQTVEAINHSKQAGVPILVAVNKIDRPDADVDRIKNNLSEHGLVPEEWGGETIIVPVSAKEKTGIKELLEMILLQAEMLELRANPHKPASGIVLEARLDRRRGPTATVLIKDGTIKVGDFVAIGLHYGRIRAMFDDQDQPLETAGPSTPVQLLGLNGVPQAGDHLNVILKEADAKMLVEKRLETERKVPATSARMTLEDLAGEKKELKIIVKGDTHGTVEAVVQALQNLSTDAVKAQVIHHGVGGITESDILLASASKAEIVGFNVRPEVKAESLAEHEGVLMHLHQIIYELMDAIKGRMTDQLEPLVRERVLGRAEVRDLFTVPKFGTVAGVSVLQGRLVRGAMARLIRDNVPIYDGRLGTLRRFKDDVKEVAQGFECGVSIENFNDIKRGDIIEAFELEQHAATL